MIKCKECNAEVTEGVCSQCGLVDWSYDFRRPMDELFGRRKNEWYLVEHDRNFYFDIDRYDGDKRIGARYSIDLERCRTPYGIVRWISHLTGKNWGTPEVIGSLVFKLDRILDFYHMTDYPEKYESTEGLNQAIRDNIKKRYKHD